jgi:hypothetical protein
MTAIPAFRSEGLAAGGACSWRHSSIALLVVDDQAALRATNEMAQGLFFAIDENRAATSQHSQTAIHGPRKNHSPSFGGSARHRSQAVPVLVCTPNLRGQSEDQG